MHQFMPKFTAAIIVAIVIYLANSTAFLNSPSDTAYVSPQGSVEITSSDERPIRSLRDFNNALVNIAEATSPAVVTVFSSRTVTIRQGTPFDLFDEFFGRPRQPQTQEREQRGQGSGVLVSEDGYILTNHHVIAEADTVRIRTHNNVELGATVVGSDPRTDVAVLKIDAENMPFLKFGDSDEMRVGEWVMAIGSPLSENLAHTVTQGIISAKGRSNINLVELEDFIQTDAAINPGNSGGPLINLDGEIIGINTAIASRSGGFQGIGFAIPINMAKGVMESLIETGRVVRGYLGVRFQGIDRTMAQALGLDQATGVIISEVEDDSPAQQAGILEGDIILEVDNQKVNSEIQFRSLISSKLPGRTLQLKVLRNENIQTKTVTLSENQEDLLAAEAPSSILEKFGFAVESMTPEKARQFSLREALQGALVSEVLENSNAYNRGLREGDLITSVNRVRVQSVSEFNTIIGDMNSGDVILLQIIRQNQRFFVSFTI